MRTKTAILLSGVILSSPIPSVAQPGLPKDTTFLASKPFVDGKAKTGSIWEMSAVPAAKQVKSRITYKQADSLVMAAFHECFNTENDPVEKNQYIRNDSVLNSPFTVLAAALNGVHYEASVSPSELAGVVILLDPPSQAQIEFFASKKLAWACMDWQNAYSPELFYAEVGVKILDLGCYLWDLNPTVSINEPGAQKSLKAYPNPALHDGEIRLQLSLPSRSNVKIEIFNTIGQLVYTGKALVEPGNNEIVVPLEGLASGLYILKALNGDREIGTQKIVIQ